jgi:hypothetical protein
LGRVQITLEFKKLLVEREIVLNAAMQKDVFIKLVNLAQRCVRSDVCCLSTKVFVNRDLRELLILENAEAVTILGAQLKIIEQNVGN